MRFLIAAGFCAFLVLSVFAVSTYAQQDIAPPVLVDVQFDPETVYTGQGPATITVTAHVTDDLSGVEWVVIGFRKPGTTQQVSINIVPGSNGTELIEGNNLNGQYRGAMTVPQYSAYGGWEAHYIALVDNVGNRSDIYSDSEDWSYPSYGFVVGGSDATPMPTPSPTPDPTTPVPTQTSTPEPTVHTLYLPGASNMPSPPVISTLSNKDGFKMLDNYFYYYDSTRQRVIFSGEIINELDQRVAGGRVNLDFYNDEGHLIYSVREDTYPSGFNSKHKACFYFSIDYERVENASRLIAKADYLWLREAFVSPFLLVEKNLVRDEFAERYIVSGLVRNDGIQRETPTVNVTLYNSENNVIACSSRNLSVNLDPGVTASWEIQFSDLETGSVTDYSVVFE